jgi:hypothetical protein
MCGRRPRVEVEALFMSAVPLAPSSAVFAPRDTLWIKNRPATDLSSNTLDTQMRTA